MSVTDGMVGHITVVRNAPVNLSQANTLKQQAANARDPKARDELLYRAALEAKYAQGMQQAQQKVQDASTVTEGLKKADPVFWTTHQINAAMERRKLAQKAAQEYNAAIPINATNRKEVIRYDL